MKQPHFTHSRWTVAAWIIIGLFLVFRWVQWSWEKEIDLGNKPVSQVFHQVFLSPIPAGVSQPRIAGMSSLSGEVWMRFHVQDVHLFLATMKRNTRISLTVPTSDLSADVLPMQTEADRDPYAHRIDWNFVYQVRHPESYVFESNPPGHGWFGQMVVDRELNTIYVHGSLM